MESSETLLQWKLSDPLTLLDAFSIAKIGETKTRISTRSLVPDMILHESANTATFRIVEWFDFTKEKNVDDTVLRSLKAFVLTKIPTNSARAFMHSFVGHPAYESWASLKKDEIDELRDIAIRSLYDSMDIGVELSGEVLRFSYQYKLMEHIKTSADLIRRCFTSHEEISAELMEDTETDEIWVVLNIFVRGETNQILDMYDEYTREWIAKVPWPACSRVRISYYPVE
ncbi:MAG: hypothetical protein ABSG75_14770 [Syntrophales bacterium]|jgi:hypothetical protein